MAYQHDLAPAGQYVPSHQAKCGRLPCSVHAQQPKALQRHPQRELDKTVFPCVPALLIPGGFLSFCVLGCEQGKLLGVGRQKAFAEQTMVVGTWDVFHRSRHVQVSFSNCFIHKRGTRFPNISCLMGSAQAGRTVSPRRRGRLAHSNLFIKVTAHVCSTMNMLVLSRGVLIPCCTQEGSINVSTQ